MTKAFSDLGCIRQFEEFCEKAAACGWHEANGGNLSCLIDDADRHIFESVPCPDTGWHELARPFPLLGHALVLITASGAYLKNVSNDLAVSSGVIELDEAGSAWRMIWGFENGAHPSSELATHLAAYEASAEKGEVCRVVYHAHCPHIIALSAVIGADPAEWTRILWGIMSESIIVFPNGLGVLPFMVPGSGELASATIEQMADHTVCIWAHHGVMARGKSFDDVFGTVETVEKAASIYLKARVASGGDEPPYLVTDEQLIATCERYDIAPKGLNKPSA